MTFFTCTRLFRRIKNAKCEIAKVRTRRRIKCKIKCENILQLTQNQTGLTFSFTLYTTLVFGGWLHTDINFGIFVSHSAFIQLYNFPYSQFRTSLYILFCLPVTDKTTDPSLAKHVHKQIILNAFKQKVKSQTPPLSVNAFCIVTNSAHETPVYPWKRYSTYQLQQSKIMVTLSHMMNKRLYHKHHNGM